MKNRSQVVSIIIILVIVGVLTLGGGIYYYLFHKKTDCLCNQEKENGSRGVVMEKLSTGGYGKTIQGAKLIFESENGKIVKETISDANGNYDINLPCARYIVTVTHPDFETYTTRPGFFVSRDCTHSIGNIFMTAKGQIQPESSPAGTMPENNWPITRECTLEQDQIKKLQPMQPMTATSSIYLVTRSGGAIFSSDNKISLEIPEDAITSNVIIQITIFDELITDSLSSDKLIIDRLASVDISPINVDSLGFLKPATLNMSYNPDELPESANEEGIIMAELGEFGYFGMSESCVDTTNHVIRGRIDKIEKTISK